MRIIVIGDVHLREPRENADWSYNHQGFLNFLESLNLTANDIIIQLGDLFEKTTHRGATNKAALKAIKYLSDRCTKVYLLQGNHDTSRYSGSNLESIDIFNNVIILQEITALVLPDNLSKAEYLFLPYIEGLTLNGKYEEEVNNYCKKNNIKEVKYIFGHHMYKQNAIMDSSYLDFDLFNFKYDTAIQGHVHKFETIKYGNRANDICLGSVCGNKKDENYKEFFYATIENDEITFNVISPKFFTNFINYTYGDSEVPSMKNALIIAKARIKKEDKFLVEQELRKQFPRNLYEIEWDIIEEEQAEKIEVISDEELVKAFFEEEKYSKDVRVLFDDYNGRSLEVI